MIDRGVKFTAVLAFDDLTALGAIRALHQAGRRVPDDCSVIGFDDVPLAALSTPALTTIRQPMEQMGSLGSGVGARVAETATVPETGLFAQGYFASPAAGAGPSRIDGAERPLRLRWS